jgi:hypothetical protein
MKYALEMGSSVMMYIPSVIKIASGIQKFKGGRGHTDTQTGWKSCKPTLGKWAKNYYWRG